MAKATNTITEKGQTILKFLADPENRNFQFGRDIAAGTFLPPRSVTGSLTSLVNKNLVAKQDSDIEGETAKMYAITNVGLDLVKNDFQEESAEDAE